MPNTSSKALLSAARAALAKPISYEAFLAQLGAKDRLNAERHVAASEAEADPRHAVLWKRLACALMTLAPHTAKFNGQQSAQFYVPDGKYRMQVFALEDLRDGHVSVYSGDVLEDAIKAGLLTAPKRGAGEPNEYRITGTDDTLIVDSLDGTAENPAAFFKDMVGWNRKAIRVVLPYDVNAAQVSAAETLCGLSARKWLASAPS